MSRKWEELEFNCLVNILGRVGTKSLVFHAPLVCKTWYRASLNPSCYQHVDFSGLCGFFLLQNGASYDAFNEYMISIVSRGLNMTKSLDLQACSSNKVLLKLAEEKKCPELKSLSVNILSHTDGVALIESIGKWKQLEELRLMIGLGIIDFPELVAVIGQNCKNFNCLAVYDGEIRDEHAVAIAVHLQKIKKIIMVECSIKQENLENIICACKDMEVLELSNCYTEYFFEQKKLRSLGSHIKTLKLDVSYIIF